MGDETSTLWLLMTIVAGAVGMGLLVYGKRQRDGISLVFGFLVAGYPYVVTGGIASVLVGAGLIGAFVAAKRLL